VAARRETRDAQVRLGAALGLEQTEAGYEEAQRRFQSASGDIEVDGILAEEEEMKYDDGDEENQGGQ
jgi:hypothetical protein